MVSMNSNYEVAEIFENRDCATFTKQGMEGVERKKSTRPVSIMTLETRQYINDAKIRGLCYRKFTADLTLGCTELPPTGALMKSGDLVLGILPERKRCWPECILLERKLFCPLIEGVRYAWVESPGELCLGDSFTLLEVTAEPPSDIFD